MNSFETIKQDFFNFLKNVLEIPQHLIPLIQFEINADQAKADFGDICTNIALVSAKEMKSNPRFIAQQVIEKFSHPMVEKIEIAGPGFLNFFMKASWFQDLGSEIEQHQEKFFITPPQNNKKIHIEFVSANPTGPMHVGHGRNGILGDVLARVLDFLGYTVHKEFYINDAGAQINKLGNSFKIRCLQQLGQNIELPEDAYHGQYLVELAQECVAVFGSNLLQEHDLFFQTYAKEHLLKLLQTTLENYGIIFHEWFSEKMLHDHGKVTESLEKLVQTGHTYELDGALWLRSTTFGDDKDRVLKKANGELTYVAADVAYLLDKIERGYDELTMVLGHDHHSYKVRLKAILSSFGIDPNRLNVILYQLVHVMKDGQPVKMSKRTGNMVTLAEIIEEVGKDVARFFFLYRKADAELQFDIDLALSTTNENPMYYIQYAYVRTMSVSKKAAQEGISESDYKLSDEMTIQEKMVLKKLYQLKTLLPQVAHNHQIHLIAHYAYEVAHLFHAYYNQERFIIPENIALTHHRLALVKLVQINLKTAMFIMGIVPMEKM
jgi:arginyl-tRNA synthetase